MSEKTTYYELLDRIADTSDQSRDFLESYMKELTTIVEEGLTKDGEVRIAGFGKLELRWMQERAGVNPQTGEEITIPGQNKVSFKPYKNLREQVNRPYSQMKVELLERDKTKTPGGGNPKRPVETSSQKKSSREEDKQQNERLGVDEVRILVEDEEGPLVLERLSPLQNNS
ncbi:MAG: HU family DNA-binding protein [Balneolaceae bacterium]